MSKVVFGLFLLLCVLEALMLQRTLGTFMPYIKIAKTCRGPKERNCTRHYIKKEGNGTFKFSLNVLNDVFLKKAKIIAISDRRQVLRMQTETPCDHIFLKPILMASLNMTKDCRMRKGYYNKTLDIRVMPLKYLPVSLIHGKIKYKATFIGDDCNIACAEVDVFYEKTD